MPTGIIVPTTQPLTAYRNGDFLWPGTISVNGAALDVTGWSGEIQFRPTFGAPGAAFLTLSTAAPTSNGSTFTLSVPAQGKFIVEIVQADWVGFPGFAPDPTLAAYDVVLTDTDGFFSPYIRGVMTLNYGATQP